MSNCAAIEQRAQKLFRNAKTLEKAFADRVTDPTKMGRTGEPLCVLLPTLNKMVPPPPPPPSFTRAFPPPLPFIM
jgi:hypothetical protein